MVSRRINPYPYFGKFYKETLNMSVPLDEREPVDVLVLETECDIQQRSNPSGDILLGHYEIYYPISGNADVEVRAGMKFDSDMNSIHISGLVTGVMVSPIGGVVVYVKDFCNDEGA